MNKVKIGFEAINEDNFAAVVQLKPREDQADYVAPNVYSLAQAYVYREEGDVFPYALTCHGEVVGFLLLEIDLDGAYYLIWRLMIGQDHQGKGYGRQVIQQVIDLAKEAKFKVVQANYVKGNQAMEHLLKDLASRPLGKRPRRSSASTPFQHKESDSMEQNPRIKDIESRPFAIAEFDEKLWLAVIDQVTVDPDAAMTFRFKNGSEVTA